MNHTIQQIIDNQKEYREVIDSWFKNEIKTAKENLSSIETSDKVILIEKKKLEAKFKKYNLMKYFDRLFFMHSSRNKDYYVWWDKNNNEALILRYDKK